MPKDKKPIRLSVDLEYDGDITIPFDSVEKARGFVTDCVKNGYVLRDRLDDQSNVYAEIYPLCRVKKFVVHDAPES